MELKLGDHLISSRFGYTHHGIYIGDNKVIHYSGLADGLRGGPVEVATLEAFAAGKPFHVRQYKEAKFNGSSAVRRAQSRLGENRYDLHANNCEHFCTWIRTGDHISRQVQFVEKMVGAFGVGLSEYRKQRFHNATPTEAASESGKATLKAIVRSAGGALALNPLVRRIK